MILLVDAARLYKGEVEGLFKPVKSKVLEDAIPAQYRGKASAEGTPWFGFSTRARVVVYDKIKVQREDVDTYEELADAKNKGKICIRSGSHPYNLSLFGAITEHLGEAKAQDWINGLKANLARDPKGGDTDQIKAVAAGECQIAVSNSYYVARLMRSSKPEDRAVMEKVAVVFPNQQSWGTHLNIAGGAVAKNSKNTARPRSSSSSTWPAPRRRTTSPTATTNGPPPRASRSATRRWRAMSGGGDFKAETIPLAAVGANQVKVQQMLDRAGFK